MANKIRITKRVKIDGKWTLANAVMGGNGRLRPDVILFKGVESIHDEGCYYIDFVDNGKRKRLPAGETAASATAKAEETEKLLALREAQTKAGVPVTEFQMMRARTQDAEAEAEATPAGKRGLKDAVDAYLHETQSTKSNGTWKAYRTTLTTFLQSCSKTTVEAIDRADLSNFVTYLKGLTPKQSDRTIDNKFVHLKTFLNDIDIHIKVDAPGYVPKKPKAYDPADLAKFFEACDEEEALWFKMFRLTGMRNGEVAHCQWSWIDFKRGILSVRENTEFNWKPKTRDERDIVLPTELLELLKAWKDRHSRPSTSLVFPTSGGRPKLDFHDCCNAIAKRAGLPVGRKNGGFFPHKFRTHRITEFARNPKISLAASMAMSGHTSYETHKLYIEHQNPETLRAEIDRMGVSDGKY